ncbi:MAG TPA: hypothetical protein VF157_02840, partial [Chloroflexota bacterium]
KANVFERMESGNCQLLPLFPYTDEGAMVPAAAMFRAGEDRQFGHFFHLNTVDEVVLVFGASGTATEAGQVYATPRLHGVKPAFRDPNDPASFTLSVITQRQSSGEPQSEAVMFRCEKCNEELHRFEYEAAPPPLERDPEDERYFPGFKSIWGSMTAAEAFNADPAKRRCPKCGHQNEPFPLDSWGWKEYVLRNETVNDARLSLRQAASGLKGG